jgi:hypothetical protein
LEEIKMLKSGGSPAPKSIPAVNQTIPSAGKLSKLAARLQKANIDTNNSVLSSPVRREDPRAEAAPKTTLFQPPAPIIAHREGYSTLAASSVVIDEGCKSDLETLLREKQLWLRSMHEENAKMATLLKVS